MITRVADTSDVDAAVIDVLSGDATLAGLVPDGVFWELAPLGATRYVVVAQLDHVDSYVLQSAVWERVLYLVKAVMQDSSGTTAKQAAARIKTILQDLALVAPNYQAVLCQRVERVRYLELDEETDQRWQHRGGQYEVLVAPTA